MTPAESLHAAALRILGPDTPQAEIARRCGTDPASYGHALHGRREPSLDLLLTWAGRLGIVVVVTPDGGPSFVASPMDCTREAILLVQRIPVLMPDDHPTADAEVVGVLHRMRDLVGWLEVGDD